MKFKRNSFKIGLVSTVLTDVETCSIVLIYSKYILQVLKAWKTVFLYSNIFLWNPSLIKTTPFINTWHFCLTPPNYSPPPPPLPCTLTSPTFNRCFFVLVCSWYILQVFKTWKKIIFLLDPPLIKNPRLINTLHLCQTSPPPLPSHTFLAQKSIVFILSFMLLSSISLK